MYAIRFPSGASALRSRGFSIGPLRDSTRRIRRGEAELPGPTLTSLVTWVRLFALNVRCPQGYNTQRPSGET